MTYELDREGNPTGGVSYHNLDKKSARDKVALYGAMRKVAEGMMGGDRPYWEMANAASERFLGSGLMSAAEAGRLSSLYRHVWNSCADPSTCSSTCTGAGKMISKANECYGKLFRSFDKALGRQTRTDLPSHRGPGSDPRTERPSGIANPTPLVEYLINLGLDFEHLNFKDHHEFSKSELDLIHSKSLVVTTEKDFSRLQSESKDQIYYLPIQLKIDEAAEFERLVETYVEEF